MEAAIAEKSEIDNSTQAKKPMKSSQPKLEDITGSAKWTAAQIDKQEKRVVFVKLPDYLKNQHQDAQRRGHRFFVTIQLNGVYYHCVRGETNRVPDEIYRMLLRSGECDPLAHEDQHEMPQLTRHRHSNLHQFDERPTLDIMPSNSVRPPRA
jgi:hypothetical protein